ncbi:MAG: hypothetical protein QOK47_1056 [Actinomycetota bacterium]|jgi:hypothetical protein|nr:hypothetical protein [Actinomycetota bacterium]
MATRAEGKFEVTGWDEETYEELAGDAKLSKARIEQEFHGDIEATGVWESVMCYCEDGTASYTGIERVVGKLGDRSGSFVLLTNGEFSDGEAKTTWEVIPGSATDDLKGLTGKGTSVAPPGSTGTFTLDYDV